MINVLKVLVANKNYVNKHRKKLIRQLKTKSQMEVGFKGTNSWRIIPSEPSVKLYFHSISPFCYFVGVENTLKNLLHSNIYLRICLPGDPTWVKGTFKKKKKDVTWGRVASKTGNKEREFIHYHLYIRHRNIYPGLEQEDEGP